MKNVLIFFKSSNFIPVFILSGVLFVFYFPILSGKQTLFNGDMAMMAYPWKFFIYKAIHEKFLPFWNPHIFNGIPFLSTLHPGVFYPFNILFLIEDYTYALNMYFVLHHLILSLSVYFLCRYWQLSKIASLCASTPTLFGAYFLSLLDVYNHFVSLVWLPLVFLFFQKFLVSKKTLYFLASLFFLLCPVLAGGPENYIMTVVLLSFYCVFCLSQSDTDYSWLKRLFCLFGMVFFTLSLSAFQIIPSLFFIKGSGRGSGLDFETHSTWSMDPSSLWKLIASENFSNYLVETGNQKFQFIQGFYSGILPILFFILAFWFWDNRKIKFWLIAFFVGLFFALGRFNLVYEFFYSWIPFLSVFRYPEKFFLICQFSLIFLTGYVVDLILKGKISKKSIFYSFFILVFFVCLVAVLKSETNWSFPFFILILFCLWFCLINLKRHKSVLVMGILPIFLILDIFLSNAPMIPMISSEFFNEPPVLAKSLNKTDEPFRIYSGSLNVKKKKSLFPHSPKRLIGYQLAKEYIFPNFGAVFGFEYADGWSSLHLEPVELWNLVFFGSPEDKKKRILERSNVKYQVKYEKYVGRLDQIPRLLAPKIIDFDKGLPRAFLVSDFRVENLPRLINVYFDKEFDPRKYVLFQEAIDWEPSKSFSGSVESIHYQPNKVQIETRQNSKAFLVLLDSWFPGWTATVDGKSTVIHRANYFYRAVALESGDHVIEFVYEPEGWKLGKAISLISFLLLSIGVFKFREKMEF